MLANGEYDELALAALLASKIPGLSKEKAQEILRETKDNIDSGKIVKVKDSNGNNVVVKKDTSNEGIYDSNDATKAFEDKYGAENISSTTNPKNPQQASSRRDDVIIDANGNKAVRVEMPDGTIKNIPYDDRVLPVFDDVTEFTTMIDHSKSPKGQMKQASKDMWESIKDDPIAQSKFTQDQLKQIRTGKQKINGYTWHHNAQSAPNNMQLIPEEIHNANQGGVPHTGQVSLNKGDN